MSLPSFYISAEPIAVAPLAAALANSRAGASVTFEGWVRNHNEGQAVEALEYEAFQALADKEGQRIVAEAKSRFAIEASLAVHRVGKLAVGDLAVWVGVSAAHRGAAFDACRYIIDEVKDRVPIWKREHYTSGTTEWINCAVRKAEG